MADGTARRIADEFSGLLLSEIGRAKFDDVIERNQSDAICCASHDHCDANMVMDTAFRVVVGRGCTLPSDVESDLSLASRERSDVALWNAAWNLFCTTPKP